AVERAPKSREVAEPLEAQLAGRGPLALHDVELKIDVLNLEVVLFPRRKLVRVEGAAHRERRDALPRSPRDFQSPGQGRPQARVHEGGLVGVERAADQKLHVVEADALELPVALQDPGESGAEISGSMIAAAENDGGAVFEPARADQVFIAAPNRPDFRRDQ